MNKYIPTALVKLHARHSMKGKFGTLLSACLIELVIVFGVSALIICLMPGGIDRIGLMMSGAFNSLEDQMYYQVNVLNDCTNVVSLISILFAFLTVGKCAVAVDVIRRKDVTAKKTFSFYSQWYVALLYPLVIGSLSYGISFVEDMVTGIHASESVIMVFLLMANCALFFFTYKLMFVNYALSDNGCTNIADAIKVSWKITDGKMFVNIIALYLSFFGWYILAMLTMGIALVYAIPYMEASVATLYDMSVCFIRQNAE